MKAVFLAEQQKELPVSEDLGLGETYHPGRRHFIFPGWKKLEYWDAGGKSLKYWATVGGLKPLPENGKLPMTYTRRSESRHDKATGLIEVGTAELECTPERKAPEKAQSQWSSLPSVSQGVPDLALSWRSIRMQPDGAHGEMEISAVGRMQFLLGGHKIETLFLAVSSRWGFMTRFL